jgi:hypothetical protein
VGGVPLIVGARFGGALTTIENAGNEAESLLSLTLMTMLLNVPMLLAPGVPVSAPVFTLNVAHVGRFAIENVSGSESASAAVGWKLYATACVAVVGGEPLIVGTWFGVALTVIANAVSDAFNVPSPTLIAMPLVAPTSPAAGVPVSAPVLVLKLAQAGLFVMLNVRVSPSGSLAVGVNV